MTPKKRLPKKRHTLPHGEGTFYYREADSRWVGSIEAGWTPKGTRRRITVTHRDEDAAWDKLQARRKVLLTEGRAAALQRSTTVQAWLGTWLDHQATVLRPNTYSGHASYVRRWIVPAIGRRALDELTAADVRAVARAVITAGRSSTTAATVQSVLQKALRDAVIEGYAVPDAALTVQKPTKRESDRDALTLPDATAVLAAAAGHPDGARWVAALLQGMRQGECLGLTWDAIDFGRQRIDVSWQLQALPYADRDRQRFRVPDGYEARRLEGAYHLVRPKSRAGQRLIPMLPWMAEPLAAWREVAPVSPHGLVWPRADGRPRTARADRAAWYALTDEAEVRHSSGRRYVLHEARGTTATLLLAARVDEKIITAIMGHSTILMSRAYMSVDEGMLRDALSRVHGLLSSG